MFEKDHEPREGEVAVDADPPADAMLRYIGRIHTPWTSREDCPRQGSLDGPECRIEVFDPWVPALKGLDAYEEVEVLYWFDRARRDLVVQNPSFRENTYGTFALRSPLRPNPIGTSIVRLVSVRDGVVTVRGLDCIDGTPLLDLKPARGTFTPKARPKPGG